MVQVINPAGQSTLHTVPLTHTVLSLRQTLHWSQVLIACGRKLQDSWTLQQCLGPSQQVYLVLQKPEEWVLFVKSPQGKTLTIDMRAKASVSDLVGLLGSKGITGIVLVFRGKMLKEQTQLLAAAGVTHNSLLFAALVKANPEKVVISMHQKAAFTLDVGLEDTLATLQAKIEEVKQVKTADQRLFVGAKELKSERKTLTSLQITDMTSIRLISKRKSDIIIYILAPKDNVYHVQLPPSSTIAQLKAEIKQLYAIDDKLELQLSLLGHILSDTSTLTEAEVKNRTKVKLVFLVSVLIRDLAGKLKRISLESTHTVKEMQAEIQKKFAISVEKQRLTCGGETVEPSKSLAELLSPAAVPFPDFFLPHMGMLPPKSLHSTFFLDEFFPNT